MTFLLTRRTLYLILFLTLPLLLSTFTVSAETNATFVVTKTADTFDGSCDSDCSLREAIEAANNKPGADTINFGVNGTFTLTIDGSTAYNSRGSLNITDSLTINGNGIDQTTIANLIKNGPRAIVITSGTHVVQIRNMRFTGQETRPAGGISNYANFTITDSEFVDMSGVSNYYPGKTLIERVNFNGFDNNQWRGSVVSNSSSAGPDSLILRDSLIFSGTGGVSVRSARIINTTINGERYGIEGYTVSDYYDTTTITGVIILEHSTITDNWAGIDAPNSHVIMNNSIVAGNYFGDCRLGDTFTIGSNNIDLDGTCGSATTIDPKLGELADNGGPTQTYLPLSGSPAIDAGSGNCPANDQRGVSRPQGAACDYGAVEVEQFNSSCDTPGLLHEWWNGIPGVAISDLTSNANYPNNPSGVDQISDFETPTNIRDNYGTRVRGYIIPPTSGLHTFWIASDDNGSLRLSSDDSAGNATEIASVPAWAPPRQWDWYPQQKSAQIYLVAGQKYYIEALMKEFGGGDNLAVAWQRPGGTRELITSNYLCSIGSSSGIPPFSRITIISSPTGPAPFTLMMNGSGSFDLDGRIVSYAWDHGDGTTSSRASSTHTWNTPGTYEVTLTVTDNDGLFSIDGLRVTVTDPNGGFECNANGVLREQWNSLWSGTVDGMLADSRYPNSPSSSSTLTQMDAPSNIGDGYGARMRAWVVAPTTGAYRFWVASDNEGRLLLSSDASAANATQIAQTLWSRQYGWDYDPGQASAEINLVAGEAYYIEGQHAASWSKDYYAVAWQTPGGSRELIPNSALCAYNSGGTRAGNDTSDNSRATLTLSPIVTNFPSSLIPDVLTVLISNEDLRNDGEALADQFMAMLASDSTLSDAFMTDLMAYYDAFYAAASTDLQAWMDSLMSQHGGTEFVGMQADDAWDEINRDRREPTSIGMASQVSQTSPIGLLATIVLMLVLLSVVAYRKRQR